MNSPTDGSWHPGAEYTAARALLDATSVDDAVQRVLRVVGECLDATAGAFWTVDRKGDCLRCVQSWGADVERGAEWRALSSRTTLERGSELPGRLWDTAVPMATAGVLEREGSARERLADRAGLTAGFGFPVVIGDGVFGVAEFVGGAIDHQDGRLLRLLATVAEQLGAFIERQRQLDELSRFFALSLDMLCVAGFDGYFKRLNPAWEAVLGYSHAELLSRPYVDFVHPDDRAATDVESRKLADGLPVMYFENRYFHKDGTIRWLLWASASFPDQQLVYAAARDITAQKAAEELRSRNASLEVLDARLAALTDAGELRDVVDTVSAIAQTMLPHDAMVLPVLLPDRAHVRFYVTKAPDGAKFPDVIPVPEHLQNSEWEYDLVDDLPLHPVQKDFPPAKLGYRSALRVPIRVEGQLAAGVGFFSFAPSVYTQSDVPIARRVADRLVLSLMRERGIEAAKRADEASARAASLEMRVQALTEELDARTGFRRVVGESPQWRQVLTQATQVAATDTTVLLFGESGTGKEVVARFIHRASVRRGGPFVGLNCAALPDQLLESELFGYERGAFTGALTAKPGQLEQANGGVLLLDEVGEMSLPAQAKFLRVLQEREFQRLGGTRVLKSNVRVIAATNRDLSEAVAKGTFREDLYYRLDVFAISLPPLRDRVDDILPLSETFLLDIGKSFGRPPAGISRQARQLLVEYSWPGNVRQLRNALERAAILCDGGLITGEHLSLPARPRTVAVPSGAPAPAGVADANGRSAGAVDLPSMERQAIENALREARHNKSKAAKALGLTRMQLYVRLRKYGLE
jgi:PAS domain S-box-containing protein